MRKLFAILTMLAALMLASVTAFAAPSLVDNAKVLTPQQRQEVLAELHKQEQAHNVRIAVVTMRQLAVPFPANMPISCSMTFIMTVKRAI